MIDIDFSKIRQYHGTDYGGFEELCCQLARLETPLAKAFHRKGPGADGGVECFAVMKDGSEIAWQTKYFKHGFGQAQVSQLDQSIKHALEKHPKLTHYIVCLNINLKDPKQQKSQTELQRWIAWVAKWDAAAKAMGRNLTIEKWDASHLSLMLTKDDPNYAGRMVYWFDDQRLTKEWFRDRFTKTRKLLGSRYTPETNVDVPIRQTLIYFSRDPSINRNLDEWGRALYKANSDLLEHPPLDKATIVPKAYRLVDQRIKCLLKIFFDGINEVDDVPLKDWRRKVERAENITLLCRKWIRKHYSERDRGYGRNSPVNSALHYSHRLLELLAEITGHLEHRDWKLINQRNLLVYGPAGIGKSHLLADAAEHALDHGQPSLIFVGSSFRNDDPWPQILTNLDYPTPNIRKLLGALDACAEASRTRAVIYIDALNERGGASIWPHYLAGFLHEAEKFKRVSVVLSCRTTFVKKTIPKSLNAELPRIEHVGFSGNAAVAAQIYLNKRGISLSSTPNFMSEFTNPLFLKTCCDFIEKSGKTEFPKGLQGVNNIFKFYLGIVCESLEEKMGLDENQKIPKRAMDAFIELCLEKKTSYLPRQSVVDAFEKIRASNGDAERSLLVHLESEGALTIEPPDDTDEAIDEDDVVRFTFERLSDYALADHLLVKHLDKSNPKKSFELGTPMYDFLHDEEDCNGGVVEALAVILPERTELELMDVISDPASSWSARLAFQESLTLRSQDRFTARTAEWVRKLFDFEAINEIAISVATEPANKFNALVLHKNLFDLELPHRDRSWSVYVAKSGEFEGSSIATLIAWLREGDLSFVDDERAELAAITVSWIFTTSNRYLRDFATKGLSRLLQKRLHIGTRLLGRFTDVNDPYVLERVLGAIYGAVLQGADIANLGALAQSVYVHIFASGKPPVNILTRDYARGVIEYALRRGVPPDGIELSKCRPPYQSEWHETYLTDEELATYTQTFRREHVGSDDIVSSTIDDGDFARYVIDRVVDDWSPAPIGTTKAPTSTEIYEAWDREFSETTNIDALEVYIELLKLIFSFGDKRLSFGSPEMVEVENLEAKLRTTLSAEEWGRYCTDAKWIVRYPPRDRAARDHAATISSEWARRWVCKRAHDLGWTAKDFAEFDRDYTYADRNEHRIERIGKKYQWIALYELAARLSDNKLFTGSRYDDKPVVYEGPWNPHLRNIDLSVLLLRTHYEAWKEWEPTWWSPLKIVLPEMSAEDKVIWLDTERDIAAGPNLIDVMDPRTGKQWLVVDCFVRWSSRNMAKPDADSSRDVWYRLDCRAVKKSDFELLMKNMSGVSLTNPSIWDEGEFSGSYQFLGEYPWHPSFNEFNGETADEVNRWKAPLYPIVTKYLSEAGEYDFSMDATISAKIPSAWLMNLMGLSLANGDTLEYVNRKGETVFFDPSVTRPGPSAGLVDQKAFLSALEKEGLMPIWVIAGEKTVHGGDRSHHSYGGARLNSRIYWIDGNEFRYIEHIEPMLPSFEQLKSLLGKDPPPNFEVRKAEPPTAEERRMMRQVERETKVWLSKSAESRKPIVLATEVALKNATTKIATKKTSRISASKKKAKATKSIRKIENPSK